MFARLFVGSRKFLSVTNLDLIWDLAMLHTNVSKEKCPVDSLRSSLRSRRFQKLTRRERNWEGVRKIRSRVRGWGKRRKRRFLFSPPPPPSRSPLPHLSPSFLSSQACSFARPLFRALVRSPQKEEGEGKQKELAATKAKCVRSLDYISIRCHVSCVVDPMV